MDVIERVGRCSSYFATLIRRRPEYVKWLLDDRNLYRRYPLTGLYQNLLERANGAESVRHLLGIFREFKQMHFLRIGARDLTGLADLAETTSQVSDLACVSLQVGLKTLTDRPELWGPQAEFSELSRVLEDFPLTVLGLGKLGGQELNYVSDVDLVFLHTPRKGALADPWGEPILLNRLCQQLSRLLSDRAEGDRVFEVDLRLRPQGKDGPLVPSSAMAVEHYLLRGHPWERQMLLKARPVAGNRSLGTAFIQEVRPFVFRRFLDFQALDELRNMRDRILAEAVKRTTGWNGFDVKLGIGGIREIEFLVQSLQLVYGGRNPELDEPNTLKCLEKLVSVEVLELEVAKELKQAYVFLRRVEHWIQLDQNRQTQKLPQTPEALERLMAALGFEGEKNLFFEKLKDCCMKVHEHFTGLFQATKKEERFFQEDKTTESGSVGRDLLRSFSSDMLSRLEKHLETLPADVGDTVFSVLQKHAALKDVTLREKIIVRLDRYFGQVARRPGLAKVFKSGSPWIFDLCDGLVRSELLAELLGHHPGLVEGVSTEEGIFPSDAKWKSRSQLLVERTRDLEESMEWLRRLKNERLLQLALQDLKGALDHEALELQLTSLADFIIQNTYERILAHVELSPSTPLSVLALGKMGSREMGYLSDLDLAFVYDPEPGELVDQIPTKIVRFVQRFMRMLSVPLIEGPGYAVDARLRPTGNYGPLIVTRKTWADYYEKEADIWEIQALLRVRCVAGNSRLNQWIQEESKKICYSSRDSREVWGRICHLRGRMQRERADEKPNVMDLKLGPGGLADFEFLVQGTQLTEGWKDPELRESSVRKSLEKVLDRTFGDETLTREFCTVHEALRAMEHRLRLHTNAAASKLTPHHLENMRLLGLWPAPGVSSLLESWEDVMRVRRRVRQVFHSFCPELQ